MVMGRFKTTFNWLCLILWKSLYSWGRRPEKIWTADHDLFLESMADAAKSVHEYFKGNIVYINVMKNMSVDCDCCAVAEDPCMDDIF